MLSFNSLLIGSDQPKVMGEFYEKVLGKKPDWSEGDWSGFKVGNGFISIGGHDKVHGKSKQPERILINFETDDVQQEFERIQKLGATVIAKPYAPKESKDTLIATFADPDGNFFQLMTPWKEE